ncbi:MAG: hypothetical protein ACFFCO_09665 [Promethearchaeota archaeon]
MRKVVRSVPSALLVLLLFVVVLSVTPNQTISSRLSSVPTEKSSTGKSIEVTDVSFYQVSFAISGGYTQANSSYGVLELEFTGSRQVEYLNLNCNGTWVIRNQPILSVGGEAQGQTQRFWFPLGVDDGTVVSNVEYGLEVSEQVLESAPTRESEAIVIPDDYVIYNGGQDVDLESAWPEAVVVMGYQVADIVLHVKNNVPNQEAGPKECAPTAVSNSLQYLNEHHNLGIPAAELTIDKMKNATNFHNGLGCWIWHDGDRPAGEQNAWYEDKAAYLQAMGWGITTKKIDPANIAQVIAEIDACEDVEMEIGGHTVCVVGMADLGGGNYSITIQHDKSQGNVGGTVTETAIWNSNTNTWYGALAGWTINYFIAESPANVEIPGFPIPALLVGRAIAVTLVLSVRRRKRL